jgi:predicted acetyltransferase
MELVAPSIKYKKSFLEALVEYQKERAKPFNEDLLLLDKDTLAKDFSSYVNRLLGEALGKNLPKGYVPHTALWLTDKNEFIGRVDIRHSLTEKLLREGGHIGYDIRPSKRNQGYGRKILKFALAKAKTLGLTKVLVTCDETNIPSKKIIETNGGVFENSIDLGKRKTRKLRYWFDVS